MQPLELDLNQITRARAGSGARRKNAAGGLDYLFARVRREFEERWALAHPDPSAPGRVLLMDFDGTLPRLGEAVRVRRISLFDSPGGASAEVSGGDSEAGLGGFDGIIIGLQMAWLGPQAVLAEALRRLRPEGTLLFCTFGPDTLQQLRRAWGEVDECPHVHPFIDMHLIGDELLGCGFTRPIVDADWVSVEYQRADLLYADLRGEGFTNILRERRKTLTGKSRFAGFTKALNRVRAPGAPLTVTFELIYGAATAPSSSSSGIRVAPPAIPG